MTEHGRGVAMGFAAYGMWGLFPLYWPLLRPATAMEMLAHRIVWSLVVVAVLVARLRGGALRTLDARRLRLLATAAVLISINWGIYIWAVNHGHVVETSLGYFINPLVTIMLGVFVLGERLRRTQWTAIAIAASAVVVLTLDYGRPPFIALSLAVSFALYGFVKKRAGVGAVESMAVETSLLVVPAVAYLLLLEWRNQGSFGHHSNAHALLLASSGLVTAVPLLCFAGAANRVPLSTLGLLQYVAPVLQFGCGVLVFREAMPPSRWLGFFLVWGALFLLAADGLAARRGTFSARQRSR